MVINFCSWQPFSNNNTECDVSGIFSGVLLIIGGGELIPIDDPSLNALAYHLLPLATSHLVGNSMQFDNNREFNVSDIF